MDHTVLDEKNAKEGLSDLLDRVEEGEEIVIARSGRPVAKLVRLHHEPRRPGRLKGQQPDTPPTSRGRLASLADELARAAKPFHELTPEERRARLQRLRGAGRGLTSGTEEFMRCRSEDIEIEERRLGR